VKDLVFGRFGLQPKAKPEAPDSGAE